MKITIKGGNLLDATEDVIAHQTNIEGAMGAGVALAIKKLFPDVYKEYRILCNSKPASELMGTVQYVKLPSGQMLANLFAQSLTPQFDEGRRCTDYDALRKCFVALNNNDKIKSIAIPYRIGSALGGGDWGIVLDIIIDACPDKDITIYKL